MQFYLEKAAENLKKGLEYQESGDYKNARRCYLTASEMMLKSAEKSSDKLKEIRLKKAQQIAQKAKAIESYVKSVEPISTSEDEKAQDWIIKEKPDTRFKDVAGLEDVKEEIRLRLIYPILYPDKAKKFGIKSGGGILLYGPPGTGKTLIARAVAGEVDATFFTVKPSQIMSKWVGEAEQNIEKLFKMAKSYERSIIFIDEVEALVPKRRDSGSTVMQRVVPQILSELEGFTERKNVMLFIGATNEPWGLDSAILRPGRFDIRIYVGLPDFESREKIIDMNLKDKPISKSLKINEIAMKLEGYSGADIRAICEKATAIPFIESIRTNRERAIEMADFGTALSKVKPSVNEKNLRKYKEWG